MTVNQPLITSISDGSVLAAGQTDSSYMSGYGISNKYTVADDASYPFAGLLMGRKKLSSTATIVTTLDKITSPTADDIIGALAYGQLSTSTSPAIGTSYANMQTLGLYLPGSRPNIANFIPGWIALWVGSSLPDGDTLYVYRGEKFTDAASNEVVPGTIVSATWAAANATAPVILLTGLLTLNALSNGITYTHGMLATFSLSTLGR